MEESAVSERVAFHLTDYVIFGITVAMSSGVGIYFAVAGGGQKTTSEYLVGNRKLKVIPVALSFVVSFESSIMMLGFPAEVYGHGTQFWMVHVGLPFTFLVMALVIVPLIHPLRITSVYQYLELRYRSRTVRLMASALGILYQVVYMGIVLFGPATALEAAAGFPATYSIILVVSASVFYTSLGGIKAVIWTDTLQFVFMVGGISAVIIMGCVHVGGFGRMWQLNVDGGRVEFLNFDPNPLVRSSFWTLMIGNTIRSLDMGFNQSTIQRVASMKTQKEAKILMLCGCPGFLLFGTLACLEGMVSYAYFAYTECDPYGAKIISNTNQVLPFVVTALFRSLPGLPGLFLAALFSASLSTLSTCLSSISAMVWTDFLQPHMKQVSEIKATIAAKVVVVVFGGLSVGVAFLIMRIGGPLQQISFGLLGSISGPLTGIFFAGCLLPFANSLGAISGAVVSFGVTIWMSLGSSFSPYTRRTPYLHPAPITNCYVNGTYNVTAMTSPSAMTNVTSEEISGLGSFYSISYHYFGPIGMLTCVLVTALVSLTTGGRRNKVDPKYIVPLWDNLCCCFPESCRRRLRLKGHTRSGGGNCDSRNVLEETIMWQRGANT